VAGYQDTIHHRATTISTCGCAPARAEPSVDVMRFMQNLGHY
jgi:hypothetical protein